MLWPIEIELSVAEVSSVLLIGNDANEIFVLSKKKQFADINNLKEILPDIVEFKHQDFAY